MAPHGSAHDPEKVLNNSDPEMFLYLLLVGGSLVTLKTIMNQAPPS